MTRSPSQEAITVPPALRISLPCEVPDGAALAVTAARVVAVARAARTSSRLSTWLSVPVRPLPSRPSTATAAPVAASAVTTQATTSFFMPLRFPHVRLRPG